MPIKLTTAQARDAGVVPKRKRGRYKQGPSALLNVSKCLELEKDADRPLQAKVNGRMAFLAMCDAHDLPLPMPEWKFHPKRKWRFDWVWLDRMLAVEVDGAVWKQGRHTRGKGFIEDQRKINEAVLLGWRVLRCTPADVKSGAVFALLKRALT